MKYRLRRVNPDVEAIRHTLNELDKRCFPLDELCSKKGEWWIVWAENEPVAFAGVRPCQNDPGMAYLCRCGVIPEHRGQGLQTRLIRQRLRWAKRTGFKEVVTDTVPSNAASANSLIRCGFKTYAPDWQWAADSIYWIKQL